MDLFDLHKECVKAANNLNRLTVGGVRTSNLGLYISLNPDSDEVSVSANGDYLPRTEVAEYLRLLANSLDPIKECKKKD